MSADAGLNQALQAHYTELWQSHGPSWRSGRVRPAPMLGDRPQPHDFCLTTLCLIGRQSAAVLTELDRLIAVLRRSAPAEFYYPAASLHATVIGCTQRELEPTGFTERRIAAVRAAIETVVAPPLDLTIGLHGLGLMDAQVFIQGYVTSTALAERRAAIATSLRRIGEQPIEYPNKLPVHINIGRFVSGQPTAVQALHTAVAARRTLDLGGFRVVEITFMLADFVLSPASRSLARWRVVAPVADDC